jgi:hypothetical protein
VVEKKPGHVEKKPGLGGEKTSSWWRKNQEQVDCLDKGDHLD